MTGGQPPRFTYGTSSAFSAQGAMQHYPNAPIVLLSNKALAVTNTFLGAR